MTFAKDHLLVVCQHFQMVSPRKGEKKACIFGPGHMTKIVVMPIYDINLKNLIFIITGSTVFKYGINHLSS